MSKFVRYSIKDCSFIGIRIGISSTYIQSCRIEGCTVRGCNGSALEAVEDWYDGSVTNCMFEVVDGYVLSLGGSAIGFDSNLLQSGTSGVLIDTLLGVTISSNYVEALHNRFLTINNVEGALISSNVIDTRTGAPNHNTTYSTFYEMQLGECIAGEVSNNRSDYQLLEITGISNYLDIHDNISPSSFMPVTKISTQMLNITTGSRSRSYEFTAGKNGTMAFVDIALGGTGNTNCSIIVEITIAGYNARTIDYLYSQNYTNTAQNNPRSPSHAAPTVVSGAGEQIILRITDTITHPVVKVKVTAGGGSYNSTLDINPTITFS
jgi:hypothetical protein